MNFIRNALFVSLLSFSSVISSLAAAAPPAATATSHPDPSIFDIPVLPEPRNGFGAALEDACDALVTTADPQAPASISVNGPDENGKLKAAAVPADAAMASVVSAAMTKTPDAAKLAQAVTALGEICKAINAGTPALSQGQLDALRAFEDSGVFPNLVSALKDEKGKQQGAPGKANAALDARALALAMNTAGGTASGAVATPSMSGFESNLLNGLADFLVTRTKEEAILYLQGEIANEFCKGDGLTVLKNTCNTITALDPSLSVAAIGTALNAAAKRDLAALPDGTLQVMARRDPERLFVYEPLRMTYAVAVAAHEGRLPLELVRSLHALAPRACETAPAPLALADIRAQEVFTAVRVASALVYSAQASGVDQLADRLPAHPVRAVGVLLEMESHYSAPFGSARKPILKLTMINDLTVVLNRLASVLTQWQQHENTLKANDSKATATDRKRVLGTTLFDTIVRVSDLTRNVAPTFVTDAGALAVIKTTTTITRDVAGLGKDLVNDDYGAVSIDATTLILDMKQVSGFSDEFTKVLTDAQKYTPLVTELASAKSSADVSTALQAAAAPADSYRAKYQRGQVALNGLVGAFVGAELPNKPNNAALGNAKDSGAFAGFAPVGIEGTVPVSNSFYLGLMGSVIDLGALTTARFKTEASTGNNVTTTTNVTFGQVFSPGGYVVIGLFKSPLVLGGGVSYAPSLRTLEATDTTGNVIATEKISAVRAGVFLAADVTLLPL